MRPTGAELFHTDGRTGRHHEANNRFPQFFRKRLTLKKIMERRERERETERERGK